MLAFTNTLAFVNIFNFIYISTVTNTKDYLVFDQKISNRNILSRLKLKYNAIISRAN